MMRSGVQSSPVAPVFDDGLTMNMPILYSFRRCPYAIRARLAILVSGVSVELREVSLANKPQEMLAASPKATVPVMVLPDGAVLEESLDIMAFALDHYDPENWNRSEVATARQLVTAIDHEFKDHLDRYKYPDKYDNDRTVHRDAGLAILFKLETRLEEHGFLACPSFSMIDAAILPFVRQFAAVDEDWFAAQSLPHVKAWLTQFLESKLFKDAMVTNPIWQAGHEPILFPR
jgi:glutathione S-transferase